MTQPKKPCKSCGAKKATSTPPSSQPLVIPTREIQEEDVGGGMDRLGLLIYQGVMTLLMLAFLAFGVSQVDRSVKQANKTLICVLSIPPESRNPETLKACE